MTQRGPSAKEIESMKRKVDLALSMSGQKEEQINVLIHSLAKLSAVNGLEMAYVMMALCQAYINYAALAGKQEGWGDE